MTRRRLVLLGSMLALAWGTGARAVVLDGVFEIEVGGDQSIWIVDYLDLCANRTVGTVTTEVCMDLTPVRSGRGQISGTGFLFFTQQDGTESVVGSFAGGVTGRVRGNDTAGANESMKFSMPGSVTSGGEAFLGRIHGRVKSHIEPNGMVVTVFEFRVVIRGQPRLSLEGGEPLMQLPTTNGDWTLTMDIDGSNPPALEGTAELEVPREVLRQLVVTGRYDAATDSSRLSLRSLKSHRQNGGIRISLEDVTASVPPAMPLDPPEIDGGSGRYRIDGYTGSLTLP